MRAKKVFEVFDRDDPNILRKIGIGKKTWPKLEPGDILRPKKEFWIGRDNRFKSPSWRNGVFYSEDDYAVIYNFKRSPVKPKINSDYQHGYHIGLHKCWDLEEAIEIRKKIENKTYPMPDNLYFTSPVEGTIAQWENRFEIYEG